MMLFTSDNWAGVHPAIMDAINRANHGTAPAYGNDALSARVQDQFSEFFETPCRVYFVTTGGAANGLALSQLVPPYGATFCHEISHIQMDEVGTPEFFTGGAKLLTIAGNDGKISPASLEEAIQFYIPEMSHHVKPKALSLTQGTETGTVYSVAEVRELCAVAKKHGLAVHMDGARFSNALAHLGCSPAEVTWKAGVDVLCFGATKNGALAAEAIIFFNEAQTDEFAWRHKRSGHVWSKNRFQAAQWEAFLTDNLWLQLATAANRQATRLAQGIADLPDCELAYPTQLNEVFATFPPGVSEILQNNGAQFYDWVYPGDKWNRQLKRLVTNYLTSDGEVDTFLETLRDLLAHN